MNLRSVGISLSLFSSLALITGCAGYQPAVPIQTGSLGTGLNDYAMPSVCSWKLKTSPNPSADNALSGVSGTSGSNVWAVGYYYSGSTPLQTFAINWNGKAWTQVTTPNPSTYGNGLFSVAAFSANDAWAVGEQVGTSLLEPLALNWNGKAWKSIKVPGVKNASTRLYSISGVSSKDIWAVGSAAVAGAKPAPYAVHWDGKAWKRVAMPNPGPYGSAIGAVSADTSKDAWVTGGTYTNASLTSFVAFTEHWNGSKWSVVKTPNANKNDNVFNAAVAIDPKNAWAIGDYYTGSTFATLTEHWNGTKWAIVKSPNVKHMGDSLSGATALSASDVWAVGASFSGSVQTTLSLHWNGKVWSIVKSPNLSDPDGFSAATAIPHSKTIWGVGFSSSSGNPYQTLTAQNTCAAD